MVELECELGIEMLGGVVPIHICPKHAKHGGACMGPMWHALHSIDGGEEGVQNPHSNPTHPSIPPLPLTNGLLLVCRIRKCVLVVEKWQEVH